MGVNRMKRSIKLKAGIFFLTISLMCSAVHYIILHPAKVSYTPPNAVISRENVNQMRLLANWEFYSFATFSSDGKWLAIVERETIRLIDTESGQQRHYLRHHQCISLLSFFIISQCDDLAAFLINTENNIAISMAGTFDAESGSIKVWNLDEGRWIDTLVENHGIAAIDLNYNGTQVAFQYMADRILRVVDLDTGQRESDFPVSGSVRGFAFSPTEPLIAYSEYPSGGVYLQNTDRDDDPIKLSDLSAESLEFTHDGRILAGWNWVANYVGIWHLDTGESVEIERSRLAGVLLSPNGRIVALSDGADETNVLVYDTMTGEKLYTLEHDGNAWVEAFSPDGTLLVTSDRVDFSEDSIHIWDVEDGSELYQRNVGVAPFVTFSPKGDLLVVSTVYNIQLFGIDE